MEQRPWSSEATTRVPGLVLVWSRNRPLMLPIIAPPEGLDLGRNELTVDGHFDPRISRRHIRIQALRHKIAVTDLGSRNGTRLDGKPLAPDATAEIARVVRIGESLLIPVADIHAFKRNGVRVDGGRVEGPTSRAVSRTVIRAAQSGSNLHISGESGVGKEGLARLFHASGLGAQGAFHAVNCATIPEGIAERLLFGTRRGAYSGADTHTEGYVQAADGGTLFLDEVADLSLPVQAKLLRVLETGEVIPLGASRPQKVQFRLCSATHKDLRAEVAAGRLREDLFYRVASPRVVMPSLRHRLEELPWLAQQTHERFAAAPELHASLVEACLLREWPGNVRELLAEIHSAIQMALSEGLTQVDARHLAESAGLVFVAESSAPLLSPSGPRPHSPVGHSPNRVALLNLLRRCGGNVSAAARDLGVHRTQLRRWLERYAIDSD